MMAAKDLKLTPHQLSPDAWWYEDNGGISIYTSTSQRAKDFEVDGAVPIHSETRVTFISWRSLRAALKRKDK